MRLRLLYSLLLLTVHSVEMQVNTGVLRIPIRCMVIKGFDFNFVVISDNKLLKNGIFMQLLWKEMNIYEVWYKYINFIYFFTQ